MVLRLLVVAKPVLLFVTTLVQRSVSSEGLSPEPVLAPGTGLFLLVGIVLLGSLVSWIGLLFLARWAGWLYAATYGVVLVLSLTLPTIAERHAYVLALDWLTVGVSVATIAMAFFSQALRKSGTGQK